MSVQQGFTVNQQIKRIMILFVNPLSKRALFCS